MGKRECEGGRRYFCKSSKVITLPFTGKIRDLFMHNFEIKPKNVGTKLALNSLRKTKFLKKEKVKLLAHFSWQVSVGTLLAFTIVAISVLVYMCSMAGLTAY